LLNPKFILCCRYCSNLIGEMRKEREFRQQCCRNSTKIGERKRKSWREKDFEFRQRCYRNSSAQIPCLSSKKTIAAMPLPNREKKKRKFFSSNCGNGIAENGRGKKIEWNCGNVIAENGRKKKLLLPKSGEELKKKKKCYIHNIFIILSQQITVISYY